MSLDIETLALPAAAAPEPLSPEPAAPPRTVPARPRPRYPEAISVLLLACAALLATLPGWLKGRVFVPTDRLAAFAPWADPAHPDARPRDPVQLDQVLRTVPWTIFAADRLRHGDVPLWNPYAGLGQPFLANNRVGLFAPTMLLHVYLPPAIAWTASAFLRLLLAGAGAWLLGGRYGLRGGPRLLAGLAYMLCGFNVVYLNSTPTNVTPWLPWAALLIERLIARPTLGRTCLLTLVLAVQFLGGCPEATAALLLTCGMLVAAHAVWLAPARAARAIPAVLAAAGLAYAIAAVQWLPWLEYANRSAAHAARQAYPAPAGLGQAARPLLGIVFPFSSTVAAGWVGTLPLMLAALGVPASRRNRHAMAWLAIGLVALVLGTLVLPLLLTRGTVLTPASASCLLVATSLALSLLAGFGLEWLTLELRAGTVPARLLAGSKRAAIAFALAACVAMGIVLLARHPIGARASAGIRDVALAAATGRLAVRYDLIRAGCLLVPALEVAAAWIMLCQRRASGASAWPWIGLVVTELLAFAITTNPGAPASTYFSHEPAAVRFLLAKQAAAGNPPFRIAAIDDALPAETAAAYGLHDLRAADGLGSLRFWEWMQAVDQNPRSVPRNVVTLDHPDAPALRLAGVRYLLAPASADPLPAASGWTRVYPSASAPADGCVIYECADALPFAWIAPAAQRRRDWAPDARTAAARAAAETKFTVRDRLQLDNGMSEDPPPVKPAPKRDGEAPPGGPSDDSRDWADRLEQSGGFPGDSGGPRGFFRGRSEAPAATANSKLDVRDVAPDQVTIRFVNQSPAWLVVNGSYDDGWTAKATPVTGDEAEARGGGGGGRRRNRLAESYHLVVPAWGALRGVALSQAEFPVYDLTLQYLPVSYKHGLFTSAAGVCVLLLLWGISLAFPAPRTGAPPGRRLK